MNRCSTDRKSAVLFAGFAFVLILSFNLADQTRSLHAMSQVQPDAAKKPAPADTLATDVATLKDKAADQSHAMMDVSYHFTNLWFAGAAENWPLAEFYWNETRSHLRWAVRIIPVRKDKSGKEIKLKDILAAVENTPLTQLKAAIDSKDSAKFEAAYRFTLEGCYSCHVASDKPYLRPKVPDVPATSIINFDPKATWPK